MIIECQSCSKKFVVKDSDIPTEGRMVQCGYCSVTWHQMPTSIQAKTFKQPKVLKTAVETDESPSVDSIKASDGKTYKFLGSQWAELLPSGKTGLFARKKISQELDEITGRWGVKVTAIEIKEIEPPPEVQDAMNKQLSAERVRRAAITESEGERQAAINRAEGQKAAAVLAAQGEREAAILTAEGNRQAEILNAEGFSLALEKINAVASSVDTQTMSLQYFDTLKNLGESPSTKWVFPLEFTSLIKPLTDKMGKKDS